MQGIKAVVII